MTYRCLVIAILVGAVGSASAADWGINFYGFSRHIDRTDARGIPFNELNPGIGVRYAFESAKTYRLFVEAAVYEDSFEETARYLALGLRYKLPGPVEVGLLLGIYRSRWVNYDSITLVPAPTVGIRFGRFELNAIYLPSYGGLNRFPALGFYGTIYGITDGP